jgi:SAM-dependent methyltransferase
VPSPVRHASQRSQDLLSSYVRDWSPVSRRRYRQAQKAERKYWDKQDRRLLGLESRYYYAGYYEWTEHRALLNPFSVRPARPENFQIAGDAMEGRAVLDVGCGPMSPAISLVHCASVHAVDPLADFYREIQPFGWEFFGSVSAAGAEDLPHESESFDFVYCRNALDHVRDADRILREFARVLVPGGQLLLGCHVRSKLGGGRPHPYRWDRSTFESRVLADFTPVRPAALVDDSGASVPHEGPEHEQLMWVGSLRKRSDPD